MTRTVYIKTTADEYELPVAIGDTITELARNCGVRRDTIYSLMCRARKDGTKCVYKAVEIEEEDHD